VSRFYNRSPKNRLKKKYNIDLSLGDILINKEALNIVFTSKHMAPDISDTVKGYTFVGSSLFFKNDKHDFPLNRLKDKKVIYISLGTLISNNPDFYKECISAFREKDYCIIISTGFDVDLNQFAGLPENFLIRQTVPQQILLERVDVFITHAGMNSVNEAICHGVPMLLIPHTFEQQLIADRVKEMDIGEIMRVEKLSAETIYQNAVQILSEDRYKNQARKYKTLFSEEEKTSHILAADEIINFTLNR
jgi:MGT family glycosyltransferase